MWYLLYYVTHIVFKMDTKDLKNMFLKAVNNTCRIISTFKVLIYSKLTGINRHLHRNHLAKTTVNKFREYDGNNESTFLTLRIYGLLNFCSGI